MTNRRLLLAAGLITVGLPAMLLGCGGEPATRTAPGSPEPGRAQSVDAVAEGERIMRQYRSLDSSVTSTTRLAARINDADGSSHQVKLAIYQKREEDGRLLILVHFTSPPEERDRDGLITVSPHGVEAVRYMQSADKFVTTTSVTGEDSLFGMSLQELVGGQSENYEHRLVEETAVGNKPAYRIEGTLKPGAESRFPRVVLLIASDSSAALAVEMYDSRNELARRITTAKVEQVSGYWTRLQWTVDNIARGKRIEFTALEVKYNQKLNDALFSREYLKKISSR